MHSFSTLLRFIWRSSKRAAVFVVGVALVGVGLVMFVTPGPGIVLVVAGLAVLATEFAWAEHLLDKAKTSAAKAGQSAQKLPGVSRATTAAGKLVPDRWRRRATATDATEDGAITAEAAQAALDRTPAAADAAPLDGRVSDGPAVPGDEGVGGLGDDGLAAPDRVVAIDGPADRPSDRAADGEPTHR